MSTTAKSEGQAAIETADPALVAGLARMSFDPNQPHPKTKSAVAVKPNEGWPPMSEKSLEQCRQIICVVAASSG